MPFFIVFTFFLRCVALHWVSSFLKGYFPCSCCTVHFHQRITILEWLRSHTDKATEPGVGCVQLAQSLSRQVLYLSSKSCRIPYMTSRRPDQCWLISGLSSMLSSHSPERTVLCQFVLSMCNVWCPIDWRWHSVLAIWSARRNLRWI